MGVSRDIGFPYGRKMNDWQMEIGLCEGAVGGGAENKTENVE